MNAGETPFQTIARAEKALCDEVAPEIAKMVRAIEEKYALQINALRIVGTHEAGGRWLNATCTLMS